jgi:anti-sigma regulatory factor (Ser/Thr protein kinase)
MVLVQSRPGLRRIEVPVRLDSIRAVRRFVAGQARAAGLDEAAAGLLVVAGVEAFTNVVRHASGGIEGAPVELVAHTVAGRFMLDLVYTGDSYAHEGPPPETDFAAFPEGGFGITIIHGASDDVEYLHDDGVNTMRIVKQL